MKKQFSNIELLIQQSLLTNEEKEKLLKEISNADKQWDILEFKLDRTEKVKHTTAILLEETIEELEQKRKTVEAQNQELEIEASLERVRAVAMGMMKPEDMLDVCKTIAQQLESLKVKEIRNVQTGIFYETKGTYTNYEFYAKHDKVFITEVDYKNHPVSEKFANQMLKGKNEVFIHKFKDKEVKEWLDYQKTTNVFIDTFLETADSLNYYWYSLGPVAIGMSTYFSLSEGEIELFKRFRNVFELAYRRYLDIEQAEAQAREAQIEAALERVRSKTMAMHRSDDLLQVITILSEQFQHLGFKVDTANFNTDSWEKDWDLWLWVMGVTYPHQVHIPYFDHAYFKAINKALEERVDFSTAVFNKEEKDSFQQYLYNHILKDTSEERKELVYSKKGFAWSVAFCKNTSLTIANYDAEPYTEEQNAIIRRFGNVFEQSYTRFLDLQKAEANAREAQIEAALERVRSSSLAMHVSEELQAVINEIFARLRELDVQTDSANILIFDDHSRDVECWTASSVSGYVRFVFPYADYDFLKDLVDNNRAGIEIFSKNYTKEQKDAVFAYIFEKTALKSLPPERKKFILSAGGHNVCVANCKTIAININRYSDLPFSEGDKNILDRFAKVFYQCYTRFLDLQKAEANAKEAQIEAAMEKIRSRSLAMHKSDELSEVIAVVFEKLNELITIKWDGASILIPEKESKDIIEWVAAEGHSYPEYFKTPYIDNPMLSELLHARDSGADYFSRIFSFDEKNSLWKHAFENSGYKNLPGDMKKRILESDSYAYSVAFEKNSAIVVASISGQILPDKEAELLKRFARTFEQAYVRFLDLQKAEAQAREAQIQLALERVRARTMAMQKQNDLLGVLDLLVEQLIKLGVHLEVANFSNKIPGGDWDLWIEVVTDDGTIYNNYVHFPRVDHPYFHHVEKNIEIFRSGGTDLFKDVFSKEEKDSWQDYINTQTIYKNITPEKHKQILYNKTGYTWSMILLKDTWVSICRFNTIPFSDEEDALFRRFANAFGQAYTRFLDLQKAEAQARESQIQLALERVRARTMAMQHSDELSEAVYVLFQQFKELGENPDQATIGVINEDEKVIEYWVTLYGNQVNKVFKFSIDEPNVTNKIYKAWKENKRSLVIDLGGKALSEFMEYRANKGGAAINPDEKRRIINVAFFSKGLLNVQSNEERSEESIKLLERFASVFEQTYTRFLDLQKAEAQAIESQIQLALERVRARTMAMQKSDELRETTLILFQQFKSLGATTAQVSICIFDEEAKKGEMFVTVNGEKIDNSFLMELDKEVFVMKKAKHAFLNKEKAFSYTVEGKELQRYNHWRNSLVGKKNWDESDAVCKKSWYVNAVFFSRGMMGISSDSPASEEAVRLLERFASVFDLTFTRFIDLQKAEAQARESQIQLALERVRARTMAMHDSKELAETALILFQQFRELGMLTVHARPFFSLFNATSGTSEIWTTKDDGTLRSTSHTVSFNDNDSLRKVFEAWKEKETFFVRDLKGKELVDYIHYLVTIPNLKEEKILQQLLVTPPDRIVVTDAFFSQGSIGFISFTPSSDEQKNIMHRFARVFEHTYTRFLDLQKAEAQAREAQIEAALEKVRSCSLAMHKSDELQEVVHTVFEKLKELNIDFYTVIIVIFQKDSKDIYWWMQNKVDQQYPKILVRYADIPYLREVFEAKEKGEELFSKCYFGEEKNEVYNYLLTHTDLKHAPEHQKKFLLENEFAELSIAISKHTGVHITSYSKKSFSVAEHGMLKRFSNVFEQSYIRFLDLQKAEAQARESQIQLALERVRARTMAMQRSEELSETAQILFQQFMDLGESPIQITIGIVNEPKGVIEFSVTDWSGGGAQVNQQFNVDIHEPTLISKIYKAWKEQKASLVVDLSGNELDKWLSYRNAISGVNVSSNDTKGRRVITNAFFSKGHITFSTPEPRPKETVEILERFANTFDLTYTRFLDLKKAEAQAREAQIESALERVRARTMAMHKSSEVTGVAVSLNEELWKLGLQSGPQGGGSIFIIDKETGDTEWWTGFSEDKTLKSYCIPYFQHPYHDDLINAWKKGEKSLAYTLAGDEKRSVDDHYFATGFKDFPESDKKWMRQMGSVTFSLAFMKYGAIHWAPHHLTEEQLRILERFAKVFEQSYTRFLDLQKAEAQAREAQIEAGLERVRARTMAMHNSEDVSAATATMFTELEKLGVENLRCGITIIHKNKTQEVWSVSNIMSDGNGNAVEKKKVLAAGTFDMNAHPLWQLIYEKWNDKEDFVQYYLEGEDKENYFKILNTTKNYLPETIQQFPDTNFQVYFFGEGAVWSASLQPHSDEHKQVMKRFTSVFSLTFRRYQDLQKAEANAREAQVEAALERVRYRAMAMQTSKDVGEATSTMFVELHSLGIETFRCGIAIVYGDEMEVWSMGDTGDGTTVKGVGRISSHLHPLWIHYVNEWRKKTEVSYYYLAGKEKEDYVRILTSMPTYNLSETNLHFPDLHFQGYYFEEGSIFTFSLHPHSEAHKQVMKRFASVFALTFRRYRDLQKAEAQAREANIEAGLERVRSRAMAMQSSEELAALIGTVFTELTRLDLVLTRCVIWIFNAETNGATWWMANSEDSQNPISCDLPYNAYEPYLVFLEQWQKRAIKFQYELSGTIKKDWDDHLFSKTGLSRLPSVVIEGMKAPERVFLTASFNNFGAVNAATLEPLSDEHIDVLLRFAKVFDLTYTRFNDLKQAETQAREAQIEAALERVRAKAMAMQNSNDLSIAASMVFTELRKLGVNPIRCGVGLVNHDSLKAQLYSATSSPDGDSLSLIGWVVLSGHPVLEEIFNAWLRQKDIFPELSGEQLKLYYENLLKGFSVDVPDWQSGEKQFGHFFSFSVGLLYAWSDEHYNDDQIKILKRFATIIDLTFRRYLELQQSEANAKEAIKQAALDRIRADIASMRTVIDLDRITPLIWNELTILGINFIRCGVFIMDDLQKQIHTFLSTPDGKAIAAFHLPYATPGNIQKVLSHWQDNKNYIDHWNESDFTQFAEILEQQKALSSAEEYLKTIPHEGFYLHFLPFLQGMLYVGNTSQLNDDEINLIQSVADAFSTAYARYEDFNRLEAAKQQIEETLVDLKQAQTQLVQSEKMASLGELTAGIAHEIQNPLNFVNNFSEVNKELLAEMNDAIEKGDFDEVKLIANDIIGNQEKINFHGKRADGIVKGMLQHSRSSSGQKELTDINALCDEYVRLAYHGLRAKDKSFNAKFETDFDPSIEKMNVVPQDIGRVLLNLINNAFYAISKRQKTENLPAGQAGKTPDANGKKFEPCVSIETKKINDKPDRYRVQISVKDNGSGIPKNIVEKIFQPFFTTKPTGQGTGLGLSLSYDIIKAHGGEIKVNTRENEGSEFIVQLPYTDK